MARALESVGVSATVSSDPDMVLAAAAVVFPGVGSAPAAMAALKERGLVQAIRSYVASGRPFLGVCLGLQLLMERSEEGDTTCLGIIPGQVRRLPGDLKVPHMGWNSVNFKSDHPVLSSIPHDSHFYFVHSYYAVPGDGPSVVGTTEYGVSFCSVYARGNLVATQFHPEKSGRTGLRVYENFVKLASASSAPIAKPAADG